MTAPSLSALIEQGKFEDLEKAWLDEMDSPLESRRYLAALDMLIAIDDQERVRVLAGMVVEALETSGREAEVLPLLEHLARAGLKQFSGIEESLRRSLGESIAREPCQRFILDKAGHRLSELSWEEYLVFVENSAFLPGKVVLHRSGWGAGLIEELDNETEEISIRFASGATRRIPWQSAVDTMHPLPEWDLRSMSLVDSEGLADLIRREPVEVLRRCLKLYRGKASSTQVKELLNEKVVKAKSWNTWWKKAKAAAVEDPLILVEGSSARPVFTLRKKALTLEEEARWALRHESGVRSLIRGLRSYLDRCTRDSDREALVRLAEDRLGPDADADSLTADRIGALVFLEELGRRPAEAIDLVLLDYLGLGVNAPSREQPDAAPHRMVSALGALEDDKTRLRIVRRVKSLGGPSWHHVVAPQLRFLPEDCLEEFIELLVEEDSAELLASAYESVAPFPKKHPLLIYLLTKAYAEGGFDGAARAIDRAVICRVIMHTLRVVLESPKGTPGRSRLLNRIVTLLVGKRELLVDVLSSVDMRTMETLRRIGTRVQDFPTRIQEVLDRTALERFPELLAKGEVPFWENEDTILCTREGLDSYQREFQHLRDVKIPENSEAIGAAASQGDLSENAEWEVAMQEQRNLTTRAAEMEEELRRAKVLDEQEIPSGVVAPGTLVRFVDLDTEQETKMRVLGPWDGVLGEDVVSYRAPLARRLLGRRPSDEVDVVLPTGERRIRILEVEKIDFTG